MKKAIALCLFLFALCALFTACSTTPCEHTYDNACDALCNDCEEVREVGEHSFTVYTHTDHEHVKACSICFTPDNENKEKHTLDDEYKCKCGASFRSELEIQANYRTVSLYNKKDLRIKKILYNCGELEGTTDYYYDKNGVLLSAYNYGSDGALKTRTLHQYDEKGNRIKKESFSPDDTLLSHTLYEHDDKSNCIKETIYYGDEMMQYITYDAYDANGNCIEEEHYEPDGTLEYTYLYAYNDQGKCTQRTFISTEIQGGYKEVLTYNDAGKIARADYYYGTPFTHSFYSVYSYNEAGQEIGSLDYNEDGELVRTCVQEYYEDGTRKSSTRYLGDSDRIVDEVLYHPNARQKSMKIYDTATGELVSFSEYDEKGNLIASS